MSNKHFCPCLNVSIERNSESIASEQDEVHKLSKIFKLIENLNKNLNNLTVSDTATLYLNQINTATASIIVPEPKENDHLIKIVSFFFHFNQIKF